jgi:transposase
LTISEERKRRVIDLYYNQGKTTREIAKIERMSIRDISAILKEDESKRQKYEDQQQQEELSSKAYKLFSEGKTPVEVAIILSLREPEVNKLYRGYWKLKRLDKLNSIYKETNGKLGPFLKLYRLMKEKGMSIEQVVNAVEIAIHKLPYMETLYRQIKDEVDKMEHTRQVLINDIEAKKNKISTLDVIAFSCEQECKRREQRVQELADKKDRLERLIANILNGEGYSKLKHIIKENVKVVLSENKQLISISFVALIQTIKADPQMVNLIQNMPSTNDGEHTDNNNITQYFESNKDRLLDLAEKHYENLIEASTNYTIDTTASSFSPTSSLQQSFTFAKPSNQNDAYRMEESKSFHHSKGDIAD